MPYKTFSNWLFDGSRTSPIPPPKDGIDILKYNSPITHTFALQLFLRHGPLNFYLDQYFNNIGARYLSKEDLFLFLKQCVLDFRVMKRDTVFYPYKAKNKLFDVLREKLPQLKNHDVDLLCDLIERSDDRDHVYDTLGLSKPPKKEKIKIGKKKVNQNKKTSVKEFLEKHFSTMDM